MAYVLAVGALILAGAGCQKAAVQAPTQPSPAKPEAGSSAKVDATVNEILNGATNEAAQADKVEEQIQNVNATDPALDNLGKDSYEIQ